MNAKNTIKTMLFGMLCGLFFSCAASTVHAESQWESVTEGVWQDPVTKDFHFKSVDKERQSDIYYRTFGFTFADAYKDSDGNVTETGLGEFNWSLGRLHRNGTTK